MRKLRILLFGVFHIAFLALLLACSPVQGDGASAMPSRPAAASVPGGAPHTAAPTAMANAPTATPPPGWHVFAGDKVPVSLYYPAQWVVSSTGDDGVEIHSESGLAWLEIDRIDGANAGPGGVSYTAGAKPDTMGPTLISTLREDGAFDDLSSLMARGGQTILITQGHDDRVNENVVIGLLVLSDHALIAIGHQGGDSADWDGTLKPLYWQIIQSIQAP